MFYDEEEEFEKLIEACNMKGIRERKLQESLRKIKDRLKLKRNKKGQDKVADQIKKDKGEEMENVD